MVNGVGAASIAMANFSSLLRRRRSACLYRRKMLARLDEVFIRFVIAGLKLKPRKCHLFAKETDYLGHVVSEARVTVSPEKFKTIVEWPTLENVTDQTCNHF